MPELEMKTKKKKENHKQKGKHNFPSCPAAGAGYPDCPVIVRYLMEIKSLLMSHVSGQSQSVLVFLSSLSSWDSLPNGRRRGTGRSHWLFLTLFVEKKKKVLKSHRAQKKRSSCHLPHCLALHGQLLLMVDMSSFRGTLNSPRLRSGRRRKVKLNHNLLHFRGAVNALLIINQSRCESIHRFSFSPILFQSIRKKVVLDF